MTARHGMQSMGKYGHSKLVTFGQARHAATGPAVRRCSTAAALWEDRFYAWIDLPKLRGRAFHCTAGLPSSWLMWPCGSVETSCQRQLRWQFSGIFPGELPPRAPRRSSSTRPRFSRRRKVLQPPLGLELSDPLAQPPHVHVLTGALSDPHRSLDRHRFRWRWPRVDKRRPLTRCRVRCHRCHPLHGPRRRSD